MIGVHMRLAKRSVRNLFRRIFRREFLMLLVKAKISNVEYITLFIGESHFLSFQPQTATETEPGISFI